MAEKCFRVFNAIARNGVAEKEWLSDEMSLRKEFQLLRNFVQLFPSESTKPVDQALDSMLQGKRGAAISPGEFLAGDTFDLGLSQYSALN